MTFNIKEFEEKLFTSLEDIRRLNIYKEELERKKVESEKLISDLDEKLGLLTTEKKQLEKLNSEIQRELEEKKYENLQLKSKIDEETQRNKNMVPIREYQNILEMNGRLLYLAQNSGNRRNLEVDFFGGEPLMNFQTVKDLVEYGRSIEQKYNKHFRFTITTNGVLLDGRQSQIRVQMP